MCWKCEQIDKHIEHYRNLSAGMSDERSAKSLDILIENLEARKAELHIVEFETPAKTAMPPH